MKEHLGRAKIYIFAVFLIAETAIYAAFNAICLSSDSDATALKYAGILLCFTAAALNCIYGGYDEFVVAAAMFFTAVADVFIFLLNDFYEIGVGVFIIVQFAYFARICVLKCKLSFFSITARSVLIAAALIALWATNSLSPLTALVAVYFPLLLCNTIESATLIKNKRLIFFFFGLILFVCCDICVGLYNFEAVGIFISTSLQEAVGSAIWAFYLPSQTLIVLSAIKLSYIPFPHKLRGKISSRK